MSVEKVKYITRKPKENKIFITSASSNMFPTTYCKWEYGKDTQSYEDKMLDIMRAINGGGLVLNNSIYDWQYAKLKTNEEMIAKYGKDYDLYDWSTMKYTIYCLGEQISSTFKPITQKEIDNDEYFYKLSYEGKNYKLFYKVADYEKEKRRVQAVLEEYYSFFEKYLNEEKEEKYYLYSQKYGYIKPKKNLVGFYYSQYENAFLEKEINFDYKKAYCIAKSIGYDIEVKKVPIREYKPTKEQLIEAKERLNLLDLDFLTDNLQIGYKKPYSTFFKKVDSRDYDLIRAINKFEKEYNCYVYYIMYNNTNFGELYSMLYVSKEQYIWNEDRKDLQDNTSYAYVWNKSDEVLSEIGSIGLERQDDVLIRTY